MKAKELSCKDLMIGDWVHNTHNHQNEQVQELGSEKVMMAYNDLYEYDEIEPIPLIAEILKKNGFHEEWDEDIKLMVCGSIIVEIGNNYKLYTDGKMYLHRILAPLYYVHEFQHALRICNIEKEIIL